MSCKREITFIMLMTQDNVIICDPEDEYSPLVKRLGGQVIRLSPSSTDYVNPLDINLNYSRKKTAGAESDSSYPSASSSWAARRGWRPSRKPSLTRAVQMIYQPYFADPRQRICPFWAT